MESLIPFYTLPNFFSNLIASEVSSNVEHNTTL